MLIRVWVPDGYPSPTWGWVWEKTIPVDGYGFTRGYKFAFLGVGLGWVNPVGLYPLPPLTGTHRTCSRHGRSSVEAWLHSGDIETYRSRCRRKAK
jgi:hypothetical protein